MPINFLIIDDELYRKNLLGNQNLTGSFRPCKRIISEAKNKGLGSSQQAKISAQVAGRKRRFCGSVATLPMLALL